MKEVDRVRQNKEDCLRIKRRAEMISHTLSLCESNVEVMNNPDATASGEPIRALRAILVEACDTVTAISAEHLICLFCRARKISKRLRKLERDIAYSHADASFAILVFLLVFRTENLAHHLQPESSSQARDK
ncbi:hypothetical protein E2562_019754 [Oryza meyeriana var. granulata]|uniref:Uncharacterized protein n=1 Tax=Oryza meyeriana var. granulata TaxID=110450 RepID=A0A6G1C916_9ORYZ|nr:hypothetical protein E2562_019754 [Oryza meyeriana var. granulata]